MTLEEILNLTYLDVANDLVNRILNVTGTNCEVSSEDFLPDYDRISMLNGLSKPTEQQFIDELAVYKSELEYQYHVDWYNSIKRDTDAALTGSETLDELKSMIEVIERELAVDDYTALVLDYITKPELTTDMDSKAIRSLIESLKAQDEAEAERLRKEDLQSRLDAIYPSDLLKAIPAAGYDYQPNLKYLRNVIIIGGCPRNVSFQDPAYAEQWMQDVEAASVSIRDERLAKEADLALKEAAKKIIQRCNDAMEYIVKFNMSKIDAGELDDAGLDNLETLFTDALTKMQNVRPNKAADLIETIDLTGTVYTETERTDIINILRGL